jgi:hypothetical protein
MIVRVAFPCFLKAIKIACVNETFEPSCHVRQWFPSFSGEQPSVFVLVIMWLGIKLGVKKSKKRSLVHTTNGTYEEALCKIFNKCKVFWSRVWNKLHVVRKWFIYWLLLKCSFWITIRLVVPKVAAERSAYLPQSFQGNAWTVPSNNQRPLLFTSRQVLIHNHPSTDAIELIYPKK